MNKQNQNGSVHVVIIGVIAAVIVGALGFMFWSNFIAPKSDQKAAASPTPSATVSPSPTDEMQSPVNAKPVTVALDAWGVNFEISKELQQAGLETKKMTYDVYPSGTMIEYTVSTARQRALVIDETTIDQVCQAGSALSVLRRDKAQKEEDRMNGDTSQPINTSPIGGYYYFWSIPSAGGCDGPDTKQIAKALGTLKTRE